PVIRNGYIDGIEPSGGEQLAVIGECFCVCCLLLGSIDMSSVDIAKRNDANGGIIQKIPHDRYAAIACSDHAEIDAVIGGKYAGIRCCRNRDCAGRSQMGCAAQEIS